MCGIAGAIGAVDPGVLDAVRRMSDAQRHRGPDQDGLFSSLPPGGRGAGVVLGHRRLSILDLSDAGRQPMRDEGSGVTLVFNGEVYNFGELRRELSALGVPLRSHSDTEVILAAYVRWGASIIGRLRGMFALAIWDPREGRVLLARDRLGIKPLYVAERAGALLFASELRALLASGRVERKLDPSGLASYLWHGFVPGPGTLIEGVRLLPAGTTLEVPLRGRAGSPQPFWALPSAAAPSMDAASAVEDLDARLAEAVKLRLVADVPLGVFLSGGVDSSAVAALAQRAADSPITTFNIRFDEARYDESPHARKVAEVLGTEHREVTLTEGQFADRLEDALRSIDQPTFDAINTYFVSRAVKEAGLTVALAGTGGDELFGGYASFADIPRASRVARRLARVPEPALQRGARLATRMATGRASEVRPQTRWGKLADVLASRGDVTALYQVAYGLFTRELWNDLALRPPESMQWGLPAQTLTELRALVDGEPDRHAVSLLELRSFLGERLLRDTDAASMAVSLEVRVPLLDHEVVEALARVPERERFEPLRKKALLRRLVSRELDPAIFDRPKAGFELPLDVWCRNRLGSKLEQTFSDLPLAARLGLDGEVVRRLWRAFDKGGPGMYWSRVWALFVLLWWCREHDVSA